MQSSDVSLSLLLICVMQGLIANVPRWQAALSEIDAGGRIVCVDIIISGSGSRDKVPHRSWLIGVIQQRNSHDLIERRSPPRTTDVHFVTSAALPFVNCVSHVVKTLHQENL